MAINHGQEILAPETRDLWYNLYSNSNIISFTNLTVIILKSSMEIVKQVAFEDGSTTSYALFSAQERGQLFISPGMEVYKGQIVGSHQRPGDLSLNVCKKKAATNIRSNKEQTGESYGDHELEACKIYKCTLKCQTCIFIAYRCTYMCSYVLYVN